MLDSIKIGNHQVSIDNIYVTGDLEFLVILLGKDFLRLNGVLNTNYIQSYD